MNFFNILFQFIDIALNTLTYPVTIVVSFINSSYLCYSVFSTNFSTYTMLYLLENNSQNYLSQTIKFFLSLHLNFDFFFFEPLVNFITHTFLFQVSCFFFYIFNYVLSFCFNFTLYSSIVTSVKFILLIAILVFVRGGIPRYRFDYLTKLGWTKFLSLILLSFLLELYLIWLF